MRIFLHPLDSMLSFHIIELLRNDHQTLQNAHQFTGFSSEDPSYMHPSAIPILNIVAATRAALQADFMILDLRESVTKIDLILRAVKQEKKLPPTLIIASHGVLVDEHLAKLDNKNGSESNNNRHSEKEDSNHQNKVKLPALDGRNNLNQKVAENEIKPKQIRLKPHHLFQAHANAIEIFIAKGAKCLITGLLYGRQGGDLNYVLSALFEKRQPTVFGDGTNLISLTCVQELLEVVQSYFMNLSIDNKVNQKQNNNLMDKYLSLPIYRILCDPFVVSQYSLFHQICNACGRIDPSFQTTPFLHLTPIQTLFALSSSLHSYNHSQQNDNIDQNKKNVESVDQYGNYIIQQLFTTTTTKPIHLILPYGVGQTAEQTSKSKLNTPQLKQQTNNISQIVSQQNTILDLSYLGVVLKEPTIITAIQTLFQEHQESKPPSSSNAARKKPGTNNNTQVRQMTTQEQIHFLDIYFQSLKQQFKFKNLIVMADGHIAQYFISVGFASQYNEFIQQKITENQQNSKNQIYQTPKPVLKQPSENKQQFGQPLVNQYLMDTVGIYLSTAVYRLKKKNKKKQSLELVQPSKDITSALKGVSLQQFIDQLKFILAEESSRKEQIDQ